MVRLKKLAPVRPAVQEKKHVSATLKVSMWFNNRQTFGSYRGQKRTGISGPRPIRGGVRPSLSLIGRGPDIPVRMCMFENACAAAVRQTEREVSRDAHSVANLATLSLDLAIFQTPLATFFPQKRLVTNLATSWTNFSESL